MTTPAPLYSGEAILLSWGESHRDGRVVRFKIEEDGTHPFKGLDTGVEKGQRFMLVAVPIQNDGKPAGAVSDSKPNGDRISKPNSTRAVMMARDAEVWEFLSTYAGLKVVTNVDEAESAIKFLCGVTSKSELNDRPKAAEAFERLRQDFYAWRRAA